MRTNNTDIWNLTLVLNGEETLNQNFKTLKEIADNLGMSYCQVSDYKNGRSKRFKNNKFIPNINITRIGMTQKEYNISRRLLKSQNV